MDYTLDLVDYCAYCGRRLDSGIVAYINCSAVYCTEACYKLAGGNADLSVYMATWA